jgi:hypothetical protein
MPSKSPQLTPTDTIITQRALATVEAFLQASGCPIDTKNAWLYLKNSLQKLSTPNNTPATPTEKEILKKLSAIEKQLSALAAALPKPLSYADHTRLAPLQSIHEKLVLSRALKEMAVKVIDNPLPNQTSEKLVESINNARSSKAGEVLAARKLKSGDIAIIADSHETSKLMEEEEGWTKVIAGRTKVKGRRFTVMADVVRTNRIEVANEEKVLAELQAQNPLLKGKVKFLRVARQKRTLKDGKLHGPLLINVGTPEEANTLVTEGLVHNPDLKNCKLFHSECQMTLCCKCQGYSHNAVTCQKLQTCRICAKQHPTAAWPTSNDLRTHFCCNRKGKQRPWDPACPVRKAEAELATAADQLRPTFYKITGKPLPPAQTLPIQFSPSPSPHLFLQTRASKPPQQELYENELANPLLCLLENVQKTAR